MAMKLKGLKGQPPNGDINVTPLIDVVLVLLIIFMVLTPIVIKEMAVNLPDKTETIDQPEEMPKDQLVAAACADGSYALNRKKMSLKELHEEIRLRLRPRAHKVVFIDSAAEAPYDHVVHLMDTARDAGADRLGVASLKPDAEFIACTPAPPAPEAPADGAPAEGEAAPAQ